VVGIDIRAIEKRIPKKDNLTKKYVESGIRKKNHLDSGSRG
jgi:hypothetical protein